MKYALTSLTRLALRFRVVTIAMVLILLVLGVVAATELNQELLPPIEFPQTIILGQVTGMTSEQVLTVVTERLEASLAEIDDIINIESQTTGAFGVVITASNDFGLNQQRLLEDIRQHIDGVWFPMRRIEAPEGTDPATFAEDLLSDLSPEVIIYLAETDSNFLFQLSPKVWSLLSDDTARASLAYLAGQIEADVTDRNALERLVEKEIVPRLNEMDSVATISVDGGQPLPGEEAALTTMDGDSDGQQSSLLLRLSPDVWDTVAGRLGLGAQDEQSISSLLAYQIEIPVEPPALPASWQYDHFYDAGDLVEIQTLTSSVGTIINRFADNGVIIGSLGQTNDLTPEIVNRMLQIEPSLVDHFQAEHLVAMSPDVFAVIPDEFIVGLDGFTRDALAAAELAQSITGEEAVREPVDLPGPWRIQRPEIITFSVADIPLAVFSVAGSANDAPVSVSDEATPVPVEVDASTGTAQVDTDTEPPVTGDAREIPEGPPLAPIFQLVGAGFGTELNTADDLLEVPLPPQFAEMAGVDALGAAEILNLLVNPPTMPDDTDDAMPGLPPNAVNLLIGGLSPEVVTFLAEYDPTFLRTLSPDVYASFSDGVLMLPQVAPPMADAWDLLISQPQFQSSLEARHNADDIITMAAGMPSQLLNTINERISTEFQGYETRLFDTLTPVVMRYFLLQEPDFYVNLDTDVLLKLSQPVLAIVPDEFVSSLPEDIAEEVRLIASGEQDSAFAAQQALYVQDIPPGDPSAPALNVEWTFLEPSYGIELDSADDFFRFPENYLYTNAGQLINSVFSSAAGAGFAPDLLGNMPIEAIEYIIQRDRTQFDELIPQAILLLPDEGFALLPEAVQQRAAEGEEAFRPTRQVTRTNGQPSLFVTVFKSADANTVSTFKAVDQLLAEIDADNAGIDIGVVFEQSSFVEDSITGVAREGSLGAVFAVIIILVFLSGGVWNLRGRRRVGIILLILFVAAFLLLVILNLDSAGGDLQAAFDQSDTVLRVLFIAGIVVSLVTLFWPGKLPDPAWRATLVIAVSIPLSILTALVGMRWIAPAVNGLILPLSEEPGIIGSVFGFLIRLFPAELTLNIMTLSGLTVAVGRVVDDSIVVLENIFRQLETGVDKRTAVIEGARDVSAAIFTATSIAVVVFLPLGLTGGIIGAFFLPFGLAVTYALIGSFMVAVTVVPVLAYLFIDQNQIPEEGDIWISRYYRPVLRAALSGPAAKALVITLAFLSMAFGFYLLGQRPAAFLPDFGEPQVTVDINLPPSTTIMETDELVKELENYLVESIPNEVLITIQTTVGGGGANFETLLTGGGVTESRANVVVGLSVNPLELNDWTQRIRDQAEQIFDEENVTVSGASIAETGFGGFSLVVSGPSDIIAEIDPLVISTLNSIDGITNVSSNLSRSEEDTDGGPPTFIRINQQTALSYSAELETQNTIGVTQQAVDTIRALREIRDNPEVSVSQGFTSEIQTEGFNSLPIAMGIAVVIVIVILIVTFQSAVYWFAIILSIVVAPVGAAIALTLTDRVLGISALIGLLMLLGLVVTNAVVLIDRVRSNRNERGMSLYDALVEAGGRRLRPILMTSLATIIALIPLAIGLSEGAIIASELGTVVIGGVFSSTLLTLIVVPVMYSVLYPLHRRLAFGRRSDETDSMDAASP